MGRRINLISGCPFDRGQDVRFHFEKRVIQGFTQEPLAAALLVAGVRIFGRSLKYHRPRGPTCLRAHCSSCLMRVNGVPNVRSCETLCGSGMTVERQSGWPCTDWDVYKTIDWLTPKTLQHHGMFTASSTLNRAAMRVVRSLSGLGAPPSSEVSKPARFSKLAADAVVVGAGVSGMAAASVIAAEGYRVVLLERDELLGGRLLDGTGSLDGSDGKQIPGWDAQRELQGSWDAITGIETHAKTSALAVFSSDRLQVLACGPSDCYEIVPERLVVCAGAYEQVPLFAGNDLPGIYGLRALDRLVCRYGVVPGEPVVLFGNSDQVLKLAWLLADQGVEMGGMVTDRREGNHVHELEKANIPIFHGQRLVRAHGRGGLQKLELDSGLMLECRVCGVEAPDGPAYELAHHAGCRVSFRSDSGYMVITDEQGQTSHSSIFAAGHCTNATSMVQARQQGERAGLACVQSLRGVKARVSGSGSF